MFNMKNNKMLKVLGNLDLALGAVLAAILIVLTFSGVLMRYIMRSPITWQEEIQMLLFLWITFLGGSAAFRTGGHIAVEILVDSLPKKIGGFIEKIGVLIQLVILGYLFSQELAYYNQLVSTNKVTNLLRIPFAYAYLVVPVGGALMILSMLFYTYKIYFGKKNEKKEEIEA